ncbi:hypothetical protein [Eupransor demetentiae]|uniref:Uncharacterized protein n=1 Tax=Eupransor demetentiae TaxID=3109584 RepID=A0ABM9N2V0_9LACO|nr:hypothetical protein R54876_GBNLAHCA_00023 [Lactobacillaceae bacterium LMG 33000]
MDTHPLAFLTDKGFLLRISFVAVVVLLIVWVTFRQAKNMPLKKVQQKKIKETDERSKYNSLRALKVSYFTLLVAIYAAGIYSARIEKYEFSLALMLIAFGSVIIYRIVWYLLNKLP